jgi:hypothetical protein
VSRTKYGKYVTREIIGESKYSAITTPIARYSGCRGGGDALTCEWSCITKPFTMDQEPEVDNERDRFLLFGGTNLEDYYAAAPTDKVLLSDESKGEVMIPKGAADYVPPIPLDEWVWPYPRGAGIATDESHSERAWDHRSGTRSVSETTGAKERSTSR